MSSEFPRRVLGDIATLEMGQSPPSHVVNEEGRGIPFLQGNAEFGTKHPQARFHCTSPPKIAREGDVLISVRAPVGAINRANQRYCIGRGLAAVRFTEADADFGIYALALAAPQLTRVAQGTTFEAVGKGELKHLPVFVPPLPEQRRIAEVLDTADEAIRQTEALIAKLKSMKQGLLHDLLTRGLDENGEPRDPIAHPEQFKDSPLGRIPRTWDVEPIGNPVARAEYGISVSLDDDDGVPVLRMNNLRAGEVDLSDLKHSRSPAARRLLLRPRDVLFNRTNSIEHVGRTSIWRGQLEVASFASYLVRLVCDETRLVPEYLTLWMNHPGTQLRIRQFATPGVQQVNINPTNLRKSLILLPKDIAEQWAIVRALEKHDARVRAEEAYRDKLQLLKKGLMQDLLTGRVRVPVPETEPELLEVGP